MSENESQQHTVNQQTIYLKNERGTILSITDPKKAEEMSKRGYHEIPAEEAQAAFTDKTELANDVFGTKAVINRRGQQ